MAYRNRGRGGGYGSGGFGYQEEYETEDYSYGGDNQWNQGIQTNRKRRNNFDQLQQFEQRNESWGGQRDSWGGQNDSYDESYERDWHGGNGDRVRRNPNPPGSQWSRQDNYTFDDYNDGSFSNSRKRPRDDYGNGGFSGHPKRGRDDFNDGGYSSSQTRGRFRDDPPPRRRDPHSVNFYDDYEEPYSRPDRSRRPPPRRLDDHRPPRDRGSRTREEGRSHERRRTESSRKDDRDRSRGSRSSYRRSTSDSHSRRTRGSHSDGNQRKKSAVEEAIYEKHRQVTVEKERRNHIGDTMQGLLLAFRAVAQILASEDDKPTKEKQETKADTKTTDNGKKEEDDAKKEESAEKLETATETIEDATTETSDSMEVEKDEKKSDEETKKDNAEKADEKMQEDESKDVAQGAMEQPSESVVESTENKDTDITEVEDDKEKDVDDLTEDYKVLDEVADNDQVEENNAPADDASSRNDKRERSDRGKIKTSTSQSSRRRATELVYETKEKKKMCQPVLLGAIKCGEAAMRMLVGDQVEGMIVVLSKKKPTRNLVERIKGLLLKAFLKDSRMANEKLSLEFDEENQYLLLKQESLSSFRVLIRFTSPQCSPDYDGIVEKGEDPADVLSPESCRVALTMIRRVRFVAKQLDPSAAALTVVRVLLYFRTIEEWSKMSVWLVLVLVHVSMETAKKAYDKSDSRDFLRVDKILIRCIEILSSGVLLPTGEGLKDPCEPDSDVGACLAAQDAEDITLAAQTAMRLIEFGKMRDVLGLPKNEKEEKEKGDKEEKRKGDKEEKGKGDIEEKGDKEEKGKEETKEEVKEDKE